MSSPLDARMRVIAREEAAAYAAAVPAAVLETSGPDRLDALAKEIADLRAAVDRVNARLDQLANATAAPVQQTLEAKPTRRTRRTAGSGE